MLNKHATIILPILIVKVSITYYRSLPSDRDFIFESTYYTLLGSKGGIDVYINNVNFIFVIVVNGSERDIKLGYKLRLGIL